MVLAAQAVARDAEASGCRSTAPTHRGAYYRTYKDAALAQTSTCDRQ